MHATEHIDVAIDTILGDHYELAFMKHLEVHAAVLSVGTNPVDGNFMMVNMSHACLSVPWRIVNAVSVRNRTSNIDEAWEVIWTRRAGITQLRVTEH